MNFYKISSLAFVFSLSVISFASEKGKPFVMPGAMELKPSGELVPPEPNTAPKPKAREYVPAQERRRTQRASASVAENNEALIGAVQSGSIPDVEVAIQAGVDLKSQNAFGSSLGEGGYLGLFLLSQALDQQNERIIELLLRAGGGELLKKEYQPKYGVHLFAKVLETRDESIVTKFLDAGVSVDIVIDIRTQTTALMYIAHKGYADMVKTLLQRQAQVDLKNKAGLTAVQLASSYPAVEQLLIHGVPALEAKPHARLPTKKKAYEEQGDLPQTAPKAGDQSRVTLTFLEQIRAELVESSKAKVIALLNGELRFDQLSMFGGERQSEELALAAFASPNCTARISDLGSINPLKKNKKVMLIAFSNPACKTNFKNDFSFMNPLTKDRDIILAAFKNPSCQILWSELGLMNPAKQDKEIEKAARESGKFDE